MNDHDGPLTITIPAAEAKTCAGCKWFDQIPRSSMIHVNAEYRVRCIHPAVEVNMQSLFGNLGDYYNYCHHFPETPEWCPYLKPSS